MRENFTKDPVKFAKDLPLYLHELVRKPLLSVELMEQELKTDDKSTPSQALVKVNSAANAYIDEYNKKELPVLVDAMAQVYKSTNGEVTDPMTGDYLYAKSAIERNDNEGVSAFSEDKNDPWNREVVEGIVKDFESKVPQDVTDNLWKAIKQLNDYTLDTYRRTGRMDMAQVNKLKQRKYYVPMKGWDLNPDAFYDYNSKPFAGTSTIHKAQGRTSKPEGSPVEQMAMDAYNAIKNGQRNLAYQHLLRLARNNSDKGNILNLQETWVVRTPNGWEETGEKPDQALIDQSKIAQKRINGLKLARANTYKSLRIAQETGKDTTALQTSLDAIDKAIDTENNNIVVRTVWDNSNFDHRTDAQAKEHEVRVWENGQSYVVHTNDPNVATAIRGENIIQGKVIGGKIWNGLANLTRAWQQNVTGKAVNFFLPNTIRDVQAAAQRHALMPRGNAKLFMENYPTAAAMVHRHIRGTAKPVYNPMADPKSKSYDPSKLTKEQIDGYWDWFMDRMVKMGARSGYVHMHTIEATRKEIHNMIKIASKGRNPLEAFKYYAWHKPGRLLEYGGVISEDTTRLATAITTHLQGYSDELASTDSKEVTVNFDRGSRIKQLMGPMYAFFQARVEGTANHASQWKHNPKGAAKAMLMWATAGALIAEALRALMDDDELKQYNNLKPYVKYGYYIIPKSIFGGSGLIKIPLAHGFGAYFAIGRIIDDVARGFLTPSEGITDVVASTYNAFAPISVDGNDLSRAFIPPLFVPIYDAQVANKDFAGRIVSRQYATEKEKQFTPNTNMGLKDVSKPILWVTRFMNDAAGGDWKLGIAPQYRIDAEGHVEKKTGLPLLAANLMDWNPSKLEHAFIYYAQLSRQYSRAESADISMRPIKKNDWLDGWQIIELSDTPTHPPKVLKTYSLKSEGLIEHITIPNHLLKTSQQ